MKKRILSMLLALVMLATLLPLGLIDTAEAATGAQILTPTSDTSGTGANGGTWECSSAGDTLTLTDYNGYPIETDATTIRFSGTNTITVPLSNLSGALRVYGLKLTSTRNIEIYGEDGSSLNIVFKASSSPEDVYVSGIDAEGPLLINTAGDITISAPYGYPYGIHAKQGLDYSGSGALDITVNGSYFWESKHWCAAYGIAAEKGNISLSGSGSKTIRVQSGANTQQTSSTPYGIYHGGETGSSGAATVSVDTGALHIEMNGDGYGIYNMGSADRAYVNINNVPELSIEKADSAIATAYSGTVNVRNSKLRIANGRYAIRNSGGTINMENADVTAAVRGSSAGYTDAAVYTGTLQVKGSSTVDMTATYGTVVYARAVSVNLSNGSFTAKTGQSEWPPIDAPVTMGVKTQLVAGVCSDADAGKYAGEKVDDLYVTSFASVESGTCGENVKWTLTKDGTLTISGTGAMTDYVFSDGAPWRSFRSQVKTVVIENGVTSIGNNAFYNCSSLTSVTIPKSVTSIGESAFGDCTSLTSVTIPNSVTSIGKGAFYNCSSLTSVTIPNSVTSIGEDAFYNCTSLTRVTIPSSVTSIEASTFSRCSSLTSVTIPNGVTHIAANTFSGCSALTSVTIPNSVTSIGDSAFDDCTSLTGVTIPSSVTRIGDSTFSGCSSLTRITIPGSVTRIGQSVFENCSSLTRITIPNSVTSIGWKAFKGCKSLPSVTIPNSVTSIRPSAFENCTSLTSVKLPSALQSIYSETFSNCTALTSVAIPKSVTEIYEKAFYYCDSLTDVYYGGSKADWKKITIKIGNEDLQNATLHTGVVFAPDDVTLSSAKAVSGGIQVTWQKAAGAATYNVYRKGPGDTYWKVVSVKQSGTSYTDKNVTAGNTYKYTVRGVASDGKTLSPGFNNTGVSATVPKPVTAPANVTLTGAKAVNGGIQVTWQKAANAATYNVYRMGPGDTCWKIVSAKQSGTSYTDKNVTAGSTYKYTVRGVAADGKTLSPGFNNTGVSATMPKTNAPANVTLTGAKAVSGGIQVTWQKAAGAAQYRVYRKDATNIKWTALTSSATGTSYVDKTAKAGVTYTYTVRGIAKDGKTLSPGFNNTGVSAVIAPAKVVLVSAKADSAGILVTWQKAAGAHSYQVYRKTAGTGWKCVAKNIHDTEWKDITAAKGTKYTYTVRGVAADGKTLSPGFDATGKTAAVTKDPTTPANVTLGKAVAGKDSITVTWSYAADARTYRVYRKAAGETKWTIVAKNAEGKSWMDKNVTKGVKYTYTVRGVSANGKALSRDCTATVSATAK